MSGPKRGDPLTDRELQVVEAFADGNDIGDVAHLLHLSENTIKSHAARIYVKLGARNQAHAVALAFHGRLLKPRPGAKPLPPPVPTLHARTVLVSVDLLTEMLAVAFAAAEGRGGPAMRRQAGRVVATARALKVGPPAGRERAA